MLASQTDAAPRSAPWWILAVLLCACYAVPQAQALAQNQAQAQAPDDHDHDHDHDHKELEELTGDLGRRIRGLEDLIICACPKEGWTRTLTFCPDACADPQKQEVRNLVSNGKNDDEILAYMKARYGPKVLARPAFEGVGKWTYLLPIVVLVVAVISAFAVVLVWSASKGEDESPVTETGRVSDDEMSRVERELESLE